MTVCVASDSLKTAVPDADGGLSLRASGHAVQGTDAPGFSLGAKPPEDRLTGKAHINAKGRVRLQKGKTENPAAWAGWKDGGHGGHCRAGAAGV